MGSETFIEVLLAILLPPIGVFLRYGCGVSNLFLSSTFFFFLFPFYSFVEFWIDVVLTFLGYIPGIIYALYVLIV
ncbi:hypothetical protein LUZ63_012229 [Rhynchospora breviuscula]|uniref:Uncharacterized protein n=1 Tax=Rhynchospora breviuscula TaxID=2022672 RepID=A0A9Q0HR74_9POAL|nr:hypothetical protein LUZ63_012229 [Rhynchospora breviuscula]